MKDDSVIWASYRTPRVQKLEYFRCAATDMDAALKQSPKERTYKGRTLQLNALHVMPKEWNP